MRESTYQPLSHRRTGLRYLLAGFAFEEVKHTSSSLHFLLWISGACNHASQIPVGP